MSENIEIIIDFNIDMDTCELGVDIDDAGIDYLPTHSLIFDLQESSTLLRYRETPKGNTLEWLWSNL